MAFEPKKFEFPEIEGISKKTIEEHIKLYEGYVKHANLIEEKIKEYSSDKEKNSYAIAELRRRFAFEFDGMRNHEYYFEQLVGGKKSLPENSPLMQKITEQFGSLENWLETFKSLCLTRGIGWAVLWYEKKTEKLINTWVDEQHIGHLNGLDFIYGIDMWEHSYLLDYTPGDKKKYVESFVNATNFEVVAGRI